MVSSYQQFLSIGNITHLPSGQFQSVDRPLARAFKKKTSSADQSPERLERLKAMLAESKTGKQTLDFLEQKGSKIVFEKMPYYGYFSPDDNLVALNPDMSDEDLAVTFVHEVRHAWQDSLMETTSPEMTPKAFLVSGYAIEADACASEVMYAHEMREKNPRIWEAHQASPYAPMSTVFERTLKETGDLDKARAASLLKWYDLKVKPSYGNTYVDYMATVANELRKQKELEPQYFAENRSTKKIVSTLFKDYDGKPFFKDKEYKALEDSDKLSLNAHQAKKLVTALIPFMKKYKRTPEDLGLDKIYVPHNGKNLTCLDIFHTVQENMQKKALKNRSIKNANSR